MKEDPLTILIVTGITAYVAYLWYKDFRRARRSGTPDARALPGATSCGLLPIGVGILGALLIVTVETVGEYQLGISEEQSMISFLFLLPMVAAAFYEELIFRGFLIVQNSGRCVLWVSIFGFSFLFALLHPHLWSWDKSEESATWAFWEGTWTLHLSTKAFFSTSILWINGLWFYLLRVSRLNPQRSLLPCFAAHLSSNLSVFFIKMAQGHVSN